MISVVSSLTFLMNKLFVSQIDNGRVEARARDLPRFPSISSLWSFMLLEVSRVCWNLAHIRDSGNSSQNNELYVNIDIYVKAFGKINQDTSP